MFRRTYLIRALVVAMLLSLPSSAQKVDTKSLRDILSKQGFTGLLRGKVTFSLLGTMKCNSAILHVYYYFWEESNPPGKAIHSSQRFIFLKNGNYLGQYVIADRPSLIKPDLLQFPNSGEDGNSIKCDREGLPGSVILDGQSTVLFR